ncbi:MAG: hypothetical protein IPP66_08870 [Anaerolineales bacterium]|nr:hypothetical protein [Anaerolineales bacterium]
MSNRKITEKPANASPSKLPFSIDRWLAIANLALTAIVGIGIAIFLQFNNQNFIEDQQLNQQYFLATQQALQQEFQNNQSISNIVKSSLFGGYANYDTYPFPDDHKIYNPAFDFSNIGPAIANNLKISVCMYSVGPMWESTINSIELFEIIPVDSSVTYEKTTTYTQCGGKRPEGISNNAVLLNFKFLPPNQSIRITLQLPTYNSGKEVTDSVKVHALIPTAILATNQVEKIYIFSGHGSSGFISGIDNYLSNKSAIATFYAEGSCDNCSRVDFEGVFETLAVSTVKDRKIDNFEITDQGLFYTKVIFDLTMTYSLPENADRIFTHPDPYLILFQNGSEENWYYRFRDIEQVEYDTYDLDT